MSGLIKKKKPLMPPPAPVKKTQQTDFSYSELKQTAQAGLVKTNKINLAKPPIPNVETEKTAKSAKNIGKNNSNKSIKVPTVIHTQINLLGSFIDETKTYAILQKLIDSYLQNELTDRQRRQFEFMVESFMNENK